VILGRREHVRYVALQSILLVGSCGDTMTTPSPTERILVDVQAPSIKKDCLTIDMNFVASLQRVNAGLTIGTTSAPIAWNVSKSFAAAFWEEFSGQSPSETSALEIVLNPCQGRDPRMRLILDERPLIISHNSFPFFQVSSLILHPDLNKDADFHRSRRESGIQNPLLIGFPNTPLFYSPEYDLFLKVLEYPRFAPQQKIVGQIIKVTQSGTVTVSISTPESTDLTSVLATSAAMCKLSKSLDAWRQK
jgi:hypothetical protein